MNFKRFLLNLILVSFGIPFRLIKILKNLLFHYKDNLNSYLLFSYWEINEEVKGRKIEFLDNKVYLNGKSLVDILKCFIVEDGTFSSKRLTGDSYLKLIWELKKTNLYYKESYIKLLSKSDERFLYLKPSYNLKMATLTSNGTLIVKPHLIYEEKGNTIHPASNVPSNLTGNQQVEIAIPSAIKWDAKNPGSILTREPKIEWELSSKGLLIPTLEIDFIKFLHLELYGVEGGKGNLFEKQLLLLEKISNEALLGERSISPVKIKNLLKEIAIGHYDAILASADEGEIVDAIMEFIE